jgi:hypothetical protein
VARKATVKNAMAMLASVSLKDGNLHRILVGGVPIAPHCPRFDTTQRSPDCSATESEATVERINLCCADGCDTQIDGSLLFCDRHLAKLSINTRSIINGLIPKGMHARDMPWRDLAKPIETAKAEILRREIKEHAKG